MPFNSQAIPRSSEERSDIKTNGEKLNLISKKGKRIPCARLLSATFGIGFIIGTVAAGIRGINAFIIPDALGFILSYTAFLFTFPGRKSEADGK